MTKQRLPRKLKKKFKKIPELAFAKLDELIHYNMTKKLARYFKGKALVEPKKIRKIYDIVAAIGYSLKSEQNP